MAAQRVGTEVALDFFNTESGQGEDERVSRRRLQVCAPAPESSPPSFIRSRAGSLASSVLGDMDKLAPAPAPILEEVPKGSRVCLEYEHVSAWVPATVDSPGLLPDMSCLWACARGGKTADRGGSSDSASDSSERPSKHRQILFDVSGCCRPGEVLALMGPSGSGKTSLLSIVGARAQSHMRQEGRVAFNGRPLTKRLRRSIGFVLQDDLLYENLTVYETLYYAAMLRLPREMPDADKVARVNAVIAALGIESCRNTIIGGHKRKGVSGGERKRVSIGHEMLINPSVLMLDEPTSGLDSTTAMHVLEILRGLATGGRAVLTTIHQPSSRLFQQLDKLLLLSQGRAMYYGRAASVDEYFSVLGFPLPYRINAADHILDLASGDISTPAREGEDARCFLVECSERFLRRNALEGYDAHAQAGVLAIRSDLEAGRADVPAADIVAAEIKQLELEADHEDAPVAADVESGHVSVPAGPRWGASYATQLRILFTRALVVRRFQSLSVQDICQFVIIGLLTGCFWFQRGGKNTLAASQDTLGLLFFELMFVTFRTLFVALFTWPEEMLIIKKERASGMYRLSAIYFARSAADLPLDFAIPTVFILIVYLMGHLRYTAAAFFANYFTVLLLALVAQGLGLLIGTCVGVPKTAQTIASIVVLTFVLTGGYFVRGIPVWISWIRYISFVFYGFSLLVHSEYKDRAIYSCVDPGLLANPAAASVQVDVHDPEGHPMCHPVGKLQDSLGLQQDPNDPMWPIVNGCALLGWLLLYRTLVYVALRWKTSKN